MIDEAEAARHRRRMRLRAWWHEVQLGGWFTASIGVLTGSIAAFVVMALERSVWPTWCAATAGLERFCDLSTDLSFQIEFGVALGIISIVGVVFTILLVSLQLISGQFSPRLLQMVFQERRSQYLIATLAGVFALAMWSLATSVFLVEGDTTPGLAPMAVALGGLVAGILLVVLLYAVARQQYIGTILERTAQRTIAIVDLLNRRATKGSPLPTWFSDAALDDVGVIDGLGPVHVVTAVRSGWVQQISMDGLQKALPQDCIVRLETRVGAFVAKGIPLISIWPLVNIGRQDGFARQELDSLDDVVHLATYVGTTRTMQDDADFGIRQMVDVVLRALSPAVNDPTTAVEGILRLSTLLRHILVQGLPSQVLYEEERDVMILQPWDLDAGEYVRHAFDQVRSRAADQPHVVICLLRTFTMLQEAIDETLVGLGTSGPGEALHEPDALHRWHLGRAREELARQQRLTIELFDREGHTEPDRSYALRGLEPQHPMGRAPDPESEH